MDQLERQLAELANTIALQAQAIADGKVAFRYAAVRRLRDNIETLMAWTPDDRSGAEPASAELRTCYHRWHPDDEHECDLKDGMP